MSVEKFIENVSIISFDDVKCPFCNARFAVREECENHIFISHSKPKDPQSGVTLFCDVMILIFKIFFAVYLKEFCLLLKVFEKNESSSFVKETMKVLHFRHV